MKKLSKESVSEITMQDGTKILVNEDPDTIRRIVEGMNWNNSTWVSPEGNVYAGDRRRGPVKDCIACRGGGRIERYFLNIKAVS